MHTRLILIRHGKPEEGDDPGLSQEGRELQVATTQRLHERVDLVLHSPLRRAEETAQIVLEVLGGRLECEPALGIEFDEATLLKKIEPQSTTVMVGHNPTLAIFGNHLLGEPFFSSGMAKSGALLLEFPAEVSYGHARFVDYIDPQTT